MKDKSTVEFISTNFCRIFWGASRHLESRLETMWLSRHALWLLAPSSLLEQNEKNESQNKTNLCDQVTREYYSRHI
jgi:hypothetical protein